MCHKSNLQTQALVGEMRRVMKSEFEQAYVRIDRLEKELEMDELPINCWEFWM